MEEWRTEWKHCVICGMEFNEKGDVRPANEAELKRIARYEAAKEREF